MFIKFGKTVAHLELGGPEYRINVNGKIYLFEDHKWCGPSALRRDTKEPMKNQPKAFLECASRWAQQGKKVTKDGLAIFK